MINKRLFYYILAAFIAGNLILVFMQYNSSRNLQSLIKGNEDLLSEFKVSNELKELEKNVISVESKIRGAISTSDKGHLDGLELQLAEIKADLDKLKQIDDNDSTIRYVDELEYLVQEKLLFSNQILDSFNHSGKQAAEVLIASQKGKQLTDTISDVIHKIDITRQRLLAGIASSIDESGRKARRWGIILISLVIFSAVCLFWFIVARIKQQQLLIQQLDASEKNVRNAARIKENFMANMSHEIRTPMNAILGFTGLLQKKQLDPESKEYVESIQESGESLLAIINDVLDLSKIEAGMMRIESAPFSVHAVLRLVDAMFKEKAAAKKLELKIIIDKTIPDSLLGDATRLSQILINLAGNAIKFTNTGEVTVKAINKGNINNMLLLAFEVKDSGIGIEKEKLSDIFERFQQAEDSITRRYGGTGLGLSIVKDLVLLQNGEITVESEQGKGSLFYFAIPYRLYEGQPATSPVPDEKPIDSRFRPPVKIMVVEDNELNQSLMKHLLKSWQIPFYIARNGREALDELQARSYDLILMDIQMPEMDGYTAAAFIRNEMNLSVPIIAMTAHAMAGEKEKCLSSGMNEYLSKPVREADLYRMIVQLTGIVELKDRGLNGSVSGGDNLHFNYINLDYMREVSGGNLQYEKEITQQFIEVIPGDIKAMEAAFEKNDETTVRQVAHNMKTSISVMGLNTILDEHLDIIEYNHLRQHELRAEIDRIKTVCTYALEEANSFLSSF